MGQIELNYAPNLFSWSLQVSIISTWDHRDGGLLFMLPSMVLLKDSNGWEPVYTFFTIRMLHVQPPCGHSENRKFLICFRISCIWNLLIKRKIVFFHLLISSRTKESNELTIDAYLDFQRV